MLESNIQGKKSYYIALILTLSILVLGDTLAGIPLLVLGVMGWVVIFKINQKKWNWDFVIVRMLILSVPLSFTTIFGQTSEDSSISWFNIFFLVLLITFLRSILVSKNIRISTLSTFSVVMIFISLIPVLLSLDLMDGLRQYMFIVMTCLAVMVGTNMKKKLTQNQKELLILDYILATRIAAIGLIVQVLYIDIVGQEIGHYSLFGGGRYAYGFLFLDFSFLSLFLSSGAIAIYFIDKTNIKLGRYWALEMTFLLIASVLTSARTGIIAFIAVFAVYSIFRFGYLSRKGSIKIFFLAILNAIILIGSYFGINSVRTESGISNDSGRGILNEMAFDVFLENPIFGIGFGRNNYVDLVGMMPHNIFFQSLAQGGLLFTIPLCLFLLTILWVSFKRDRRLLPVILCVLVGAFFIPNIFHSRFLPTLLLLLAIRV